ncbi:AraC-like DNA-binding protein [Pedobacter sp. UYP30]|uniref:helix-turn-helix domain-containing protein n=1 Tax=Pedobacter sp. UYP30 TaxID=1756400 RepID=UPI00339B0CC6
MIYNFPPTEIDTNDNSFLVVENTFFAKFKKENKTAIKKVFLTENVLVFILKGHKQLHIENETVQVTSQEIIFLKKGIYAMAEYFEKEQQFEAILLFLNPKIIKEVVAQYQIQTTTNFTHVPFLKIESNPIIETYKNQLSQYFTENSLKDKGILLLKQKEILLYLLKTVPSSQTIPFWDSVISTSSENIMYVMEKYLFQKLSLKDYANLTNRSLSTFKRDFASIYSSSPTKWINQKRLEYSCLLLKNTKNTISETAENCGFESLSYFTRIFKKTYMMTPTEFRTNN